MNMNYLNNQCIRTYNGTNHDVSIYAVDDKNFKSNRHGSCYYLTDAEVKPIITFEQKNALDINKTGHASYVIDGVRYSLPDSISSVVQPSNPEEYDTIIVSRFYAEKAMSCCSMDFVDRLYTVGMKIIDAEGNLIGNEGLQKVSPPRDVYYYIRMFENNQHPSLSAALLCINSYQSNFQDPNALYAVQTLWNYVYAEMQRRQQKYSGQLVFNV